MSAVPFKVLLGMEQVSMPSASETTQQPTRPRASAGNRSPLASPSPPPVQYKFPITPWLSDSFLSVSLRRISLNAG